MGIVNLFLRRIRARERKRDSRWTGNYETHRVAHSLIEYLRKLLQKIDLDYSGTITRIFGGYETITFSFQLKGATDEFSKPLILRVFRETQDPGRARFESIVQNEVRELGFPVPRVIHYCVDREILGGGFMIMERLPGKNMKELALIPSPLFFQLPGILARMQARLHKIEPDTVISAIRADGFRAPLNAEEILDDIEFRINRSDLEGLRHGFKWIREKQPCKTGRRVICHGDLQFSNIIIADGNVSGLIDWGSVKIEEPELDVGTSIRFFERVFIDAPRPMQGVLDLMRRWMIQSHYEEYTRYNKLDLEKLRYHIALNCLNSLTFFSDRGTLEQKSRSNVLQTLSRFKEISGIKLVLP